VSEPQAKRPMVSLMLLDNPRNNVVVPAPPALTAGTHTTDYCCGKCQTVLMYAEAGQVQNLIIKCAVCGSYNSTDI
jgi:hypothetical protein